MPSRLTVVLVSLLFPTCAVIFWLWLVILPAVVAIECPVGCRCETQGIYINCSGSGLESIPLTFPTHVRILTIDGNNITCLEKNSFVSRRLVTLEILKADFCKLREIELGAFNGLEILTNLSLESNEIGKIIPGTFEMLSGLEYLYLDYNKIEHLGSDVFCGLVNLIHIGLEGNKLHHLHPDTFLGLPKFQSLLLSKNSDLQIPTDHHFINSHSLRTLVISDCNVSSMSVQSLANVSTLESLDLSYNNLRSVDINILEALPTLSTMYLYDNPLQCDCQLQEVWRWCQDHNIQTSNWEIAPECDTPRELKGIWWGVLEKVQCSQSNIHYFGDHRNRSDIYTHVEDTDTETQKETGTETEQGINISSFVRQYGLPLYAVLFIFGTTGNVLLIIVITCNKNMRTVPNMYIFNLAISDLIYLVVLFSEVCANSSQDSWLHGDIVCVFFPFCYRMSVSLSAYSVALLSFQRYRVTVYPFDVRVSSIPTWHATVAIICGVWIVAALFAIPAASLRYLCHTSVLLLPTNYYQNVAIFHLLVSCVIPVCVIAFSYIMTARHIVARNRLFYYTRQNNANFVLGLTVVFLISYVPYHISETYFFLSVNLDSPSAKLSHEIGWVDTFNIIYVILQFLFPINSCLNPIALFCTSSAFRWHFKRYLTCCYKTQFPATDFFELTRLS